MAARRLYRTRAAEVRRRDEEGIARLVPFLESIAREVAERDEALDRIERALVDLERRGLGRSPQAVQLIAEAALHRRELRSAGAELERVGCALLSRRPPTIHIAGSGRGWLWQTRKDSGPR